MPGIQAYTPMQQHSQHFPKYTQAQSHRKSGPTHPAWFGALLLNRQKDFLASLEEYLRTLPPTPHSACAHPHVCLRKKQLPSKRARSGTFGAAQWWRRGKSSPALAQHQDHKLRYALPALAHKQSHALGGSTRAMGKKFDSTKFSLPSSTSSSFHYPFPPIIYFLAHLIQVLSPTHSHPGATTMPVPPRVRGPGQLSHIYSHSAG